MTITHSHRFPVCRSAVAAGALAAALLSLPACGEHESAEDGGHRAEGPAPGTSAPASQSASESASASAPESDSAHNAADVSFVQRMIPHHRQAVEMADLALARKSAAADVRKLAEGIRAAQAAEIETLTGWLGEWGEKVPDGGTDHTGHDAGHEASGMMGEERMAELAAASGRAFDTAFLEMMIEHHEGAVEMARAHRTDGAHAPARELAADIVTHQTAEIERMTELLGGG